jgi:hypothetical protein
LSGIFTMPLIGDSAASAEPREGPDADAAPEHRGE